jgi:hypothetical protein
MKNLNFRLLSILYIFPNFQNTMKKLLSALFIFSLIQLALGHGWLVDPVPKGFVGDNTNSASTSGPCGAQASNTYTLTLVNSSELTVTWSLGGGHDTGNPQGPAICRFSLATTNTSQTAFDSGVVADNIPCTVGSDQTTTIPITGNGLMYLQFHWLAGDNSNWYGCALINVSGVNTTASLFYNQNAGDYIMYPITGGSNVITSIAYGPTADVNQHLLIVFNGTINSGNANVTGSLTIPTSYLTQSYLELQTGIQSVSVCKLPQNSATGYVGIFPSSDFNGNISLQAYTYQAELDFVSNSAITIAPIAGETFVYWSASYSTISVPRKISITGRGGPAYLMGPYQTCSTNAVIWSTSPIYCIDLPLVEELVANGNDKYYYPVYFAGDYNGQIQVQLGSCNGVGTIVVSFMALLIVAFLF